MTNLWRALCALLFAVTAASPAAAAQIKFLNPFGSPQGSVQQLVTASATTAAAYPCTPPPVGTAATTWQNRKWKMANALAWTANAPYAVCLGTTNDYVRFELHDTSYDHGANDASYKRRAEIGTNANFRNGTTYWLAYSFRMTLPNGVNKNLGNTTDQLQDPLGSSPSISHRLVYCGAASPSLVCLRTTTRYDEGYGTTSRGQAPFALAVVHDLVVQFQTGANGFEKTWLDGKLVSSFSGPIGTTKGDGYGWRIGTYGAPLGGMQIVQEYKNSSPLASTVDLSGRLLAPPAW